MNFEYSQDDADFRLEVRRFIREHLPADIARRTYVGFYPPRKSDRYAWHRALYQKGWAAPHWPVEYGGTGWSALRQHIFEQECCHADVPTLSFSALRLVAPVLYTFGTCEQQQRFLPPILSGEMLWCQGFSEPNAGSDLASLRTTAMRDGDHYVVNGSKIWTSESHQANWGFFLVRTDTKAQAQKGISFLLIDMKSPGISIRPIIMISGAHTLNQVFLENVRVPVENLVGEEGRGWSYAKFLLGNERAGAAFVHFSRRELDKAKEAARRETADGVRLIDDPLWRRRFAQVEIELQALEWSVLRILSGENSSRNPGALASALKTRGTELQQKVVELAFDVLGPRAVREFTDDVRGNADLEALWPDHIPGRAHGFLHSRAYTIYGGSSQIQKNIIAKQEFAL